MAFCLPFSTALTLIFSALGTLFGLVGFDWEAFKKVVRHPIAILCVALFGWLALSMLWSIAPTDEMIEGISKYRKLLYVPLIGMLLITTRVKPWFLMNFFVAGCLVVCVGSLFSSAGLAELVLGPQNGGSGGWLIGGTTQKAWFYVGPPNKPTFGRAHIAQGAFLVIAINYVLGSIFGALRSSSRVTTQRETILIIYFGMLLVVTANLGGLTGYVLLILLGSIWTYYFWRPNYIKTILSWSLIIILIFAIFYLYNDSVHSRVTKSTSDIFEYLQNGTPTSEGLRLHFWQVGLASVYQSPILGFGVGSYAEVYNSNQHGFQMLVSGRPQPHSEFILQAVQGGSVGLLMMVLMVFTLMALLRREKMRKNPLTFSAIAASLLLLADGLFNSVIWDLAEGHMYSLVIGLIVTLNVLKNEKVINDTTGVTRYELWK